MIFDCYGESDSHADILQKKRIECEMFYNFIDDFFLLTKGIIARFNFYFPIYNYLYYILM